MEWEDDRDPIIFYDEDVDLENWTMTGGMKTAAGKNRLVPIHEKIKDLVKRAKVQE